MCKGIKEELCMNIEQIPQKDKHIRNIHLNDTDDGWQAMCEEMWNIQMNKKVMHKWERWQWRLWSGKPCSNHGITLIT